jgi:hypothetical protein
MTDENKQSIPSLGSQPVAWAVLRIDGSIYDVYANEEEAKAIDEAVTGNHGVVTLYGSPTLTNEERAAIGMAYSRLTAIPHYEAVSATLRGLLERLG